MPPIDEGSVPARQFDATLNRVKLDITHIVDGREPLKWLELKSNTDN